MNITPFQQLDVWMEFMEFSKIIMTKIPTQSRSPHSEMFIKPLENHTKISIYTKTQAPLEAGFK